MNKLTKQVRNDITRDWLVAFPSLGWYREMHLLRRVGPLLEGVVLDRTSSNDEYRPTFHVHCLAIPRDFMTLSLCTRLRAVRSGAVDHVTVRAHETRWRASADLLRVQALLPLSGDLELSQVVRAYRSYLVDPNALGDPYSIYEEIIRVCIWCGCTEWALELLAEGQASIARLPEEVRSQAEDPERWRSRLESLVRAPNEVRTIVENQAERLEATTLPSANLLW